MTRLFPYPLLTLALTAMWLLLQQSAGLGHILLGFAIAWLASLLMARLQPHKPRIRRWDLVVKLVYEVTLDIVRSNIAVVRIIVAGNWQTTRAGFIRIPLTLTDPMGLAILACIVTATPGSAWLEYDAEDGSVLIHVLDLINEEEWMETLKTRYETLLLEIFQ